MKVNLRSQEGKAKFTLSLFKLCPTLTEP